MTVNIKRISIILALVLLISVMASTGIFAQRVITDMAGREVELPDEVNRVVTTYRTATQFVFALNVQDRLVASDRSFERISLFNKLYNGEKLPNVGSKRNGLNLEQIIEVNPDLVILFPHNEGPDVAERLEEFGIASVIIIPESYKQIEQATEVLGQALGVEKRADLVISKYNEIIELVEKTSEIEDKKKVYFANTALFDTIGENMLQTSMIEMAGGINPAKKVKSGFIKTSLEELINWNPDYIVVSQYYSGTVEELKNRPELQELKAIKNDNVFRFPSQVEPWDFPSPSSYLGIVWLAEKIYPERFDELNLQGVIDDYYNTLYNKSYQELGGDSL
ncbi:MAG: ABC transporter substrate-binding protein [Halanaerobiales bacterium]|nr:ABC transporter substrate-binding protein [Halanaerobiales bacterium]